MDEETRPVEGTEEPEAAPEKEKAAPLRAEIYDWVETVIVALVVLILVFIFVFRIVRVDGSSMIQTLHNNDLVITSNLFYTPKYGDIIVFDTESSMEPLVKRVIATGGQTVDIDFIAGVVYVDGEPLDERYTNTLTTLREDFSGPVKVPEGMLFVMGDNRNGSLDSRSKAVGLVDERAVIGKVYFILMPGRDENGVRDWSTWGRVYD